MCRKIHLLNKYYRNPAVMLFMLLSAFHWCCGQPNPDNSAGDLDFSQIWPGRQLAEWLGATLQTSPLQFGGIDGGYTGSGEPWYDTNGNPTYMNGVQVAGGNVGATYALNITYTTGSGEGGGLPSDSAYVGSAIHLMTTPAGGSSPSGTYNLGIVSSGNGTGNVTILLHSGDTVFLWAYPTGESGYTSGDDSLSVKVTGAQLVCLSCSSGTCPAGGAGSDSGSDIPGNGDCELASVDVNIGLGGSAATGTIGRIGLKATSTELNSLLYSPSSLEWSAPANSQIVYASDGTTLRQIKTPQAFVDVISTNGTLLYNGTANLSINSTADTFTITGGNGFALTGNGDALTFVGNDTNDEYTIGSGNGTVQIYLSTAFGDFNVDTGGPFSGNVVYNGTSSYSLNFYQPGAVSNTTTGGLYTVTAGAYATWQIADPVSSGSGGNQLQVTKTFGGNTTVYNYSWGNGTYFPSETLVLLGENTTGDSNYQGWR
jgi:hypothetical protein